LVADSLKWVHFIFGEWNSSKFPGNLFTADLLPLRLNELIFEANGLAHNKIVPFHFLYHLHFPSNNLK